MTPSWSQEIKDLYLSGAANQFVLHGNVNDRLLLPALDGGESTQLGNLYDFLTGHQLRKFDLIFTYDLGHGLRVDKHSKAGRQAFEAWPSAREDLALPKSPRDGIAYIDHFLRYTHNLARLAAPASAVPSTKSVRRLNVGVLIRDASLVLPAHATPGAHHEILSAAALVRSWSTETPFLDQHLAVFLVAGNLNDLHPMIAANPRVAAIAVPLPTDAELEVALQWLAKRYPRALGSLAPAGFSRPASRLAGASLSSVEAFVKEHDHRKAPITDATLAGLKKRLVEKDCQDLIEFVEPHENLDCVHGHDAVKAWLRQDIALWHDDDLKAMPMGYLFCGPVGTGKTFLVECLAGEAEVPVVKFKNFRDRWVGSTEGNLERIFTFLRALGRCLVFIDEADQALGSRSALSGDSGVSARVYSMMAKEMGNTRNRGRIIWILASSRPDLIEVDLKRPGRTDVKIPLFPTANASEAYALLRALAGRLGVDLPSEALPEWESLLPDHLTPGGAEAIAVKIYRLVRTRHLDPSFALIEVFKDYQDPIPAEVMSVQIALAVREASDLSFVPSVFRTPSPIQ